MKNKMLHFQCKNGCVNGFLKEDTQRFCALIEHSFDAIALFDQDGKFLCVSPAVQRFLGYMPEELVGHTIGGLVLPEQQVGVIKQFETVVATADSTLTIEYQCFRKDGTVCWIENTLTNKLLDSDIGAIVSNFRAITERKPIEALLKGEKRAFELMTQGASLTQVLDVLARFAEEYSTNNVLASVLLLDEDGAHLRHVAAPSLPPSYTQAIDGAAIGPVAGSCGTAAYRNEAVYVFDIATDPLWANYAELALKHGLRACWSTPIRDPKGRVLGTFALYYRTPHNPCLLDHQLIELVTHVAAIAIEQKRAEEAFKRNEEQLHVIFTHVASGIAFTTAHGHVLQVNPAYCTITGYNREELAQQNLLHIIHPDDVPFMEARMHALTEGIIPAFTMENRYLRKDREIVWIRSNISSVRDANKNILYLIFLVEDITERKKREEEHYRLAAIVESSTDAIISKSLDDKIIDWNQAAERLFGYSAAEVIGLSVHIITPPEFYQEEEEFFQKLQSGIHIQNHETERIRKDGKRVKISLSISPIKDSKGQITGIAKIMRDISERKELERRKDEFIVMASHELKTPVTSLKVLTQVLQRRCQQRCESDLFRMVTRMDVQLDRLNQLINDLLDISKMQTGQLEYREESFALDIQVREMVEQIQEMVPSHRITLEQLAHAQVFGDRDRLGQVLMNLLTNAVKYSPQADQIIVRVTVDTTRKTVRVSVQDFGFGIAEDQQDKIFERFYRVNDVKIQTFPGLGMGLYISNEIIKRHRGRLWVESSEGEGSTFIVELPLFAQEKAGPESH